MSIITLNTRTEIPFSKEGKHQDYYYKATDLIVMPESPEFIQISNDNIKQAKQCIGVKPSQLLIDIVNKCKYLTNVRIEDGKCHIYEIGDFMKRHTDRVQSEDHIFTLVISYSDIDEETRKNSSYLYGDKDHLIIEDPRSDEGVKCVYENTLVMFPPTLYHRVSTIKHGRRTSFTFKVFGSMDWCTYFIDRSYDFSTTVYDHESKTNRDIDEMHTIFDDIMECEFPISQQTYSYLKCIAEMYPQYERVIKQIGDYYELTDRYRDGYEMMCEDERMNKMASKTITGIPIEYVLTYIDDTTEIVYDVNTTFTKPIKAIRTNGINDNSVRAVFKQMKNEIIAEINEPIVDKITSILTTQKWKPNCVYAIQLSHVYLNFDTFEEKAHVNDKCIYDFIKNLPNVHITLKNVRDVETSNTLTLIDVFESEIPFCSFDYPEHDDEGSYNTSCMQKTTSVLFYFK